MYFTQSTFDFLDELTANNNRDWFAANKDRYTDDVQTPGRRLIDAVAGPLRRVAPFLVASSSKSGGSMTRIYRDTRFSKDKTPYKNYVGIQFRHDAGKDIHAPGIYVHVATDECFIGAGCWQPEPSVLAKIRARIDGDAKAWKRARDDKKFAASFTLWGEQLKTSPRDYPKDHPMIDDLRRKDFIGLSPVTRKQMISDDLVAVIIERVKASRPLMRFLCDAIGVPY